MTLPSRSWINKSFLVLPALGVVALGAAGLALWLSGAIVQPVNIGQEDEPVAVRPVATTSQTAAALPAGTLTLGSGQPAAQLAPSPDPAAQLAPSPELAGAWPWFRGPSRDNISTEPTPLLRDLGAAKRLWTVSLGEGYAAPAVLDGCAYILDYDQVNSADALRCLSLADGAEVWRYSYPLKVKRNHGMSRTVPAVTDQYVVALGPKCHVTCLDAKTGRFVWGMDLVGQFGTIVPEWYAGQCPLIDGERVILAPGGSALAIAVELASGKILWQCPNPNRWNMSHASLAVMELGGRKMYVYAAAANPAAKTGGGLAGIDAQTGEILWESTAWQIPEAVIASPLPLPDGRIFLGGGYGAGCLMLQVKLEGDKFTTAPLWRLNEKQFGAVQQTPIFYQDHIYGVRPDGQMTCLDLAGNILWTSGQAKFGLGPFMIADGHLLAMDDSGLLTLAEFSPTTFKVISQSKILDGHDSWGPFALTGGLLLARDLTSMVCLDLRRIAN
jgi:outer membrane protein assembly factor BamB